MELVLPNNYVEIEEEEMMYLDGGAWSSNVLYKNIMGIKNRYSSISNALRGTALFAATGTALKLSYWAAVSKFGWDIVVTATYIGGFYGACLAIGGTAFAVTYFSEVNTK